MLLTFTMKNVKSLEESEIATAKISNVPWSLKIWKSTTNLLKFRIGCNESSASTIWLCSVDLTIHVKNIANDSTVSRHLVEDFKHAHNHVEGELRGLEVTGDVVDLEVKVEFAKCHVTGVRKRKSIDYSERNPNFTNGVLMIEGKNVHINKQLLALHSDYFKSLFFSEFEEKSQEAVELHEVKYTDFINFLDIIHPTHAMIDESSVEQLLELADRFLCEEVTLRCEEFLIKTDKVHMAKKLVLGEKFTLDSLLHACISSFKKLEDMAPLKKAAAYHEMNDSLKSMLLDRLVQLHASSD